MSALFCLFLCLRTYYEKLEEYIPKVYKIRYILEELYVAVMWIISPLTIYIDQLNEGIVALKVSKSRKQNMKSRILPEKKNTLKISFYTGRSKIWDLKCVFWRLWKTKFLVQGISWQSEQSNLSLLRISICIFADIFHCT